MTMICDLPDDLETEILSMVPANSLWRLKTTCKRWNALFRDLRFVEKNKRLGKGVRESILLSNDMVYSISGDLHSCDCDTPIKVSGKLKNLKALKDLNFSHIFHCGGLMLCYTKEISRLVVWNPCTGQTRSIKPKTCYGSDDNFALGYTTSSSSSGHSYKILRYWNYQNDQKVWVGECEIYELSSDSWRVLDSFTSECTLFCHGMSLKGDTYWVGGVVKTGFFLLKFDFTTERFVRLPLPFPTEISVRGFVLSVVRDEKLSLLRIDRCSDVMRIWVSNKFDDKDANKDLSWRSHFVFKVDIDNFNMYCQSFLLDEENKVAVCCGKYRDDGDRTIIYIVGEDIYKQVYEDTVKKASRFNWPCVLTYVPSLFCIH